MTSVTTSAQPPPLDPDADDVVDVPDPDEVADEPVEPAELRLPDVVFDSLPIPDEPTDPSDPLPPPLPDVVDEPCEPRETDDADDEPDD